MRKTVVLYPSKDHYQRTEDSVVPLAWAIAYLQQLQRAIPGGEAESALVSWPPKVTYEHTLSAEEQMRDRLDRAREVLGGLSRDRTLTEEQLAALRSALGM